MGMYCGTGLSPRRRFCHPLKGTKGHIAVAEGSLTRRVMVGPVGSARVLVSVSGFSASHPFRHVRANMSLQGECLRFDSP